MKLNKNTQLTILIITLFCIIIFLIIAKLSNSNPTDSTDPTPSPKNNPIQNHESPPNTEIIPTSSSNHIGETNSNGDPVYYESDLDQELTLPSPQTYTAPTTSPNQESEDEEDIGDISLDFPMERYLPYQGRYFRIEKYYDANNLEVLVGDKSKTDLAKEEVKQWLIDQGNDQYDKFTIVYR